MSPSENKKAVQKMTVPLIQKMKRGGEKIVMVTCYDYSFARLIDEAGVDIVLVGDSLGMVIQGQKSTLPVTLEEMIYHSRCVAHGLTRPLLVTDMPFMSYQSSQGEAIKNAGRLLKEGKAESIKLEGGVEVADLIHRMNRIGIPVMGHIGLQPQSLHKYGGYKIQGKTPQEERHLLEDALAVQEAGCWSVVLEGVPVDVAQKITGRLKIPTVGIGCG
ncbi:MAG: 3-methyl-2-oxobutanoate hydroxymethyltransferase, partial [Deltaproteobacteria bacterium]|nr:3-methyl-2-oxobutanoate hydroxymethyltransferase [Deltaproteobacteria bacterium]